MICLFVSQSPHLASDVEQLPVEPPIMKTHTKGWMPPALMYDMGDKLEELGYTRPPRTKSVLSSSRKKGGAKRHGRHHRTRRRMRRHGMPEHTDKRE